MFEIKCVICHPFFIKKKILFPPVLLALTTGTIVPKIANLHVIISISDFRHLFHSLSYCH